MKTKYLSLMLQTSALPILEAILHATYETNKIWAWKMWNISINIDVLTIPVYSIGVWSFVSTSKTNESIDHFIKSGRSEALIRAPFICFNNAVPKELVIVRSLISYHRIYDPQQRRQGNIVFGPVLLGVTVGISVSRRQNPASVNRFFPNLLEYFTRKSLELGFGVLGVFKVSSCGWHLFPVVTNLVGSV